MRRDPSLRAFVKYDRRGNAVPSVLIYRKRAPKKGIWKEITADLCCPPTTTSTTTTTTTTA